MLAGTQSIKIYHIMLVYFIDYYNILSPYENFTTLMLRYYKLLKNGTYKKLERVSENLSIIKTIKNSK